VAKVIQSIQVVIQDTTGDPSSPDTTVNVSYVVKDSVNEDLQKHQMYTKTITITDSVSTMWAAIKSAIETDEGIS